MKEIVIKIEVLFKNMVTNDFLVILVGCITAIVVFITAVAFSVLLYKIIWRRDEYKRFQSTIKSHNEDEEVTLVGYNAIYRPPESRHYIMPTRIQNADFTDNNWRKYYENGTVDYKYGLYDVHV